MPEYHQTARVQISNHLRKVIFFFYSLKHPNQTKTCNCYLSHWPELCHTATLSWMMMVDEVWVIHHLFKEASPGAPSKDHTSYILQNSILFTPFTLLTVNSDYFICSPVKGLTASLDCKLHDISPSTIPGDVHGKYSVNIF